MKYFSFLLLLLPACSTPDSFSYHSPGPYHGLPILGSGTYLQEVVLEPRGEESYRFRAVFQRKEQSVLFSAMNASGQTIFRILDSLERAREPELKILSLDWAAKKEQLQQFYRGFRPLLLLNDKPSKPDPLVRERFFDQRPRVLMARQDLELVLEEFDWNMYVRKLTLLSSEFAAHITLREYHLSE